jgi:hypothetical protein
MTEFAPRLLFRDLTTAMLLTPPINQLRPEWATSWKRPIVDQAAFGIRKDDDVVVDSVLQTYLRLCRLRSDYQEMPRRASNTDEPSRCGRQVGSPKKGERVDEVSFMAK